MTNSHDHHAFDDCSYVRPQPALVRAAEPAAAQIKAMFPLVKQDATARQKGDRLWINTVAAAAAKDDMAAKRAKVDDDTKDISMVRYFIIVGSCYPSLQSLLTPGQLARACCSQRWLHHACC